MAITSSFFNSYKTFMEQHSHPSTKNWFLMGTPVPLLIILVTYVYFCKSAGPRFMRDRKPYDLKNVIVVYNIIQVLLSVYIVWVGTPYWIGGKYNFACEPVGNDYAVQSTVWVYFMCKIIELLDTVFFVLRKKYNQVSYLHVYHHTLMPICAWIGTNFLPGGHGTLLGYINSFIHIIMYAYYLISSMGPQYQKYLWWKKYLTSMQLIQFVIIFVHNFQVMFRTCDYPKFINFLLLSQAAYFLYLFGLFYKKTYLKNSKTSSNTTKPTNGIKISDYSKGVICNGYVASLYATTGKVKNT
ncbi:elongation of very long chain fatty acids protein AAEL008004 [Aethina tumida]|uniref:elongation of very long chain fatty acids protein AAEL008004 n=1 Tax=Aethina tumida TaxID=116153 RepID=UPI00096B02F5|nr:elongation of very long chain fatty acids protein AAEL008004 [Aethina tumida]XP_019870252.1 elongation of very long chain fatty acids protein AAEL008004 [Aethina tumida]XP_049823136.1 elongation of very long chain fatty acids protein AAEL008004 [Aethina tumida]